MNNEEKKLLGDNLKNKSGMAYESSMREVRSLNEVDSDDVIIVDPKSEMHMESKEFGEDEKRLEKKYKLQQRFTYGMALMLIVMSFVCYLLVKEMSSTIRSFAGSLVLMSGIAAVVLMLSALCRRIRFENGSYIGY